jgi:mono/diheme cytochrome c family protein
VTRLVATGVAAGLAVGLCTAAGAESPAVNYMLHCQGCHLGDGSGKAGAVPALAESVARFATLPQGRAYLIRVPGASHSPLSDADLAAVLTYIVQRFGPADAAAAAAPFTRDEVAAQRRPALLEVESVRAGLLRALGDAADRGD